MGNDEAADRLRPPVAKLITRLAAPVEEGQTPDILKPKRTAGLRRDGQQKTLRRKHYVTIILLLRR
jgi:hypothetical protein